MGKIYCVMGKSSSGKDTVYKKLKEQYKEFRLIVPYTTRPIREGEKDGVEYYFVSEELIQENAPQVVACGVIFVCNQSLFSKNGTTKSIHS